MKSSDIQDHRPEDHALDEGADDLSDIDEMPEGVQVLPELKIEFE